MDVAELQSRLKNKSEHDLLVDALIRQPSMIGELLEMMGRTQGSLRFTCTKLIRRVSEQHPEIVYVYFDQIADFLQSENSFIKWDGISILSNLAAVDTYAKFDGIFEAYFDLIKGPDMITAANVVSRAWKIVLAKPQYEPEITKRLSAVTKTTYYHNGEPSPECNNVVCAHVIDCFSKYYVHSHTKESMLDFVKAQRRNTRTSVVKKAEKFLKVFAGIQA